MVIRWLPVACVIFTSLDVRSPTQGLPAPPAQWAGARFDGARIGITVAETGSPPREVVVESAPRRAPDSLTVTDVAFDVKRNVVYIGTCCEPGSGQLRRVDLSASRPAFVADDQGFAVDVGGKTSTLARTDTFGTFAIRSSPAGQQEVRAAAGASDVAVDGTGGPRVIALVQAARLRALVPTVSAHEPGLVVLRWKASRWSDSRYPLPAKNIYCRAVALTSDRIGLLAGEVDPADPRVCTGDRLDVYDTARKELRPDVMRFPGMVGHLSVDDSSTFLIFTTVDGAVRWRTLAGASGNLATGGFRAADW